MSASKEAIQFWENDRDALWATPSIKTTAQLKIDALKKAKDTDEFIVCRGDVYGSNPYRILNCKTGREEAVPVEVESVFLGKIRSTATAFKSAAIAKKGLADALAARTARGL